ncbi:MAG: hypothetical protein JJE50_10815 [Actinomycetales bacterium]|nr:hypothetical protein [Actinomycetales bacterium]
MSYPYGSPEQPGPNDQGTPAVPGPPPAYGQQESGQPGYGQQAGGYSAGSYQPGYLGDASLRRPGTVTAAAILTWLGGVLMTLLGFALAAIAGSSTGRQQLDLTADQANVLLGAGIGSAVWSILAIVLAVFVFRGSKGAAIGLTVLGALFIVFGLATLAIGSSTGGVGLPVAWVAVAIVLFRSKSARSWYAAKSAHKAGTPGY